LRLYTERFLPWFMETILSRPTYREQRRDLLRLADGLVLEIGFGFGGSLSEYTAGRVRELVALEPNPGMLRRARPRVALAPFPVHAVRGLAEAMPFARGTFDTVVSNWTLCSLESIPDALREIRRVLAGRGRLLFLEHGLSEVPALARRQRLLTPVQRLLADGCRLDLDMEAVVRQGGFRIESIDRYESRLPLRSLRQMYRGVARPLSDGELPARGPGASPLAQSRC
jgi:ubiquinone/menaquinone biosynthesis C-methylase UbiE